MNIASRLRDGIRPLFVASVACLGSARAAETSVTAAEAVPLPAALETCARLRSDSERLACYDKFVAPRTRGAADPEAATSTSGSAGGMTQPGTPTAAAQAAAHPKALSDDVGSYLDEFWELTPERKRGLFNFDGFRPNYVFPVHATNRVNTYATSPTEGRSGERPDYKKVEAKFQISVRTKLAEGLLLPDADLWFAYTQQAVWQVYSGGEISRPFRAIDHEPELFYVVPTPLQLPLGFKLKMVGLGIAHQSDGQTRPFSRSWNRYYALGGIENGQFAFTARQNVRISEKDSKDDNPDFTHYRGKTELLGLWTPGFFTASALVKTNFTSDKGSVQLDFTLPVSRKDPKGLRWYAQVFSGYGETLIDYNFRQTSIGAGVSLFGW